MQLAPLTSNQVSGIYAYNNAQPTVAAREVTIGKHKLRIEVFVDHYYTFNYRVGYVGQAPRFGFTFKTNRKGIDSLHRKADELVRHCELHRPIHGPASLNDYGYPIHPNGRNPFA